MGTLPLELRKLVITFTQQLAQRIFNHPQPLPVSVAGDSRGRGGLAGLISEALTHCPLLRTPYKKRKKHPRVANLPARFGRKSLVGGGGSEVFPGACHGAIP